MPKKEKIPSNFQSIHVRDLESKTPSQKTAHQAFLSGKHLLLHGAAGTGKTHLALSIGLKELVCGNYDRLVIIRSIVPTRDVGFLPGTLEEKISYYEIPYTQLTTQITGKNDTYNNLKQKGVIQFLSTSHLRGTTISRSIVLLDEVQNLSFHECDSVITRLDDHSRLLICGDYFQSDLKNGDKKGILDFMNILKTMDEFATIEFGIEDIVRSGMIRSYLIKKNQMKYD